AAVGTRLKAELQALVGPDGPSRELIEDWKKRFPPPTTRAVRTRKEAAARNEDESETEESAELGPPQPRPSSFRVPVTFARWGSSSSCASSTPTPTRSSSSRATTSSRRLSRRSCLASLTT